MDSDSDRFTFQTFDDSGAKRQVLAHQMHGSLAEHWSRLSGLNALGAGIFVTVNETDGLGRKAENVTNVRALFADFDTTADTGERLALVQEIIGVEPSLVVESSSARHHAYWLADGLSLDEFRPLQQALATALGSDPVVKDLCRVMRLPGFVHRKERPFVTRVIHEGPRTIAEALRVALASYVPREAPPAPSPMPAHGTVTPYAKRALESAAGAILSAPTGSRNTTLNREAHNVFGLVKGGHLDEHEARHVLERAGGGSGLSNGEVQATLASAWNAATTRVIPERPAAPSTSRPGPEIPPAPPFAFAGAGELVAALRPINWLVCDRLEADSLALMYGEPGHGKSFVALDLAASVATGTPWHDHPTKQGAVFVVAGEGHNGIARRLKAWELARGISLNAAPLYVSRAAASLADPTSSAAVTAAIEALVRDTGQKPALVVVDTVSRNLGAADENSSADMAAFVRSLDAMRHRWNASVLMVHHSGKDSAKGARGSTVLKGAVDAEYRVAKDEAGVVCLEATKMKDAERPAEMAFDLKGVKLPLVDEEGADVWGAALKAVPDYQPAARGKVGRGKNQTLALAALRGLYDDHRERLARGDGDPDAALVRIDDWRERLATDGLPRQRFYDAKVGLERAGWVKLEPPYVRLAE
ncbi:AAA family ATPase [Halomonas sp. PR-M31]|uniref:AAA family ATPase n=1 Tax=Halomonas sp. PR-M31 TaxID=1471202 RepID=UPI00155A4CDC|nr:AAA family ATPase [Halomonas sp. PR-M31]